MQMRDEFEDSDEEAPRKSPKIPRMTPRLTGLDIDGYVDDNPVTGLSPLMRGPATFSRLFGDTVCVMFRCFLMQGHNYICRRRSVSHHVQLVGIKGEATCPTNCRPCGTGAAH